MSFRSVECLNQSVVGRLAMGSGQVGAQRVGSQLRSQVDR